MRDVIQHQTSDRNRLQIIKARCLGNVRKRRIIGVKSQWNERDEAVSLVLQSTQLYQVIGAVFLVLQMSVQHGAIRVHAQFMSNPRRFQPLITSQLVIADNAPHALRKNFRATTRHRIHPGIAQPDQHVADRHLLAPRKVPDLHHRERLQMNLWIPFLQATQHLAEPVQVQFRMQPAHNVELGDLFTPALTGRLPNLLQRHRVGIRVPLLFPKSAETATGDAHIRRVDMAVDVEVRHVAMHPLTHGVGHVTQGQHIVGTVQGNGVLVGETNTRLHFFADGQQTAVFKVNVHIVFTTGYRRPRKRRIAR